MKTTDKYVGLDVHKDTTVIAVAEGEVRVYGTISSDLEALEKVMRKLGGEAVPPQLAPQPNSNQASVSLGDE